MGPLSPCCRLLAAIDASAVEDELVPVTPCRVRGAGQEHSEERPVPTVRQILQHADVIAERSCSRRARVGVRPEQRNGSEERRRLVLTAARARLVRRTDVRP